MAVSPEPSTAWREIVAPDEQARHTRQAERFSELQRAKDATFGVGRALHRKQRAGLRATFEVFADLPEPARHGIFAEPRTFDAQVRLSNGGFAIASDKAPDIRGFSIKVLDVHGPAALGGEAAEQDFTLINRAVFGAPNSDLFVQSILVAAGPPLRALAGIARNPRLISFLPRVLLALRAPFGGFATHEFFSAAPLACGPYAIRVKIAAAATDAATTTDWRADILGRLADAPLVYAVQVQFFLDEQSTPIEDASRDWLSPYVTVGRLTLLQQDSDPDLDAQVDAARFDPWNALASHRPLGEVMRARKVAYFASQQNRHAGEHLT